MNTAQAGLYIIMAIIFLAILSFAFSFLPENILLAIIASGVVVNALLNIK